MWKLAIVTNNEFKEFSNWRVPLIAPNKILILVGKGSKEIPGSHGLLFSPGTLEYLISINPNFTKLKTQDVLPPTENDFARVGGDMLLYSRLWGDLAYYKEISGPSGENLLL